jgi:hypothetical protein
MQIMKTTTTKLLFLLATGPLGFGSVLAGTLDPPGSPAATMVTLQQIFDKLGAPAAVAKTGQIECSDVDGNLQSCTGTGQDGEFRRGVSVSPRFTDNANGTVKDNLTGLIWLKNTSCFGLVNWTTALDDSNTLASGACGLTDGSVAGSWRLPNVREVLSLADFGRFNPALPAGHPFSGVIANGEFWSSTSSGGNSGGLTLWTFQSSNGTIGSGNKLLHTRRVWPVRDGQ